MCLSYAAVPLELELEKYYEDYGDDEDYVRYVDARNLSETLKALRKFEAEVIRLSARVTDLERELETPILIHGEPFL